MFFKLALVRLTRRLRARRSLGFAAVGIVVVLSILLNAVLFWAFDRNAHGEDRLGLDEALWYSIISITTIGYGDYSAQTFGARVSTVVFIVLVGLSAFSVFFGMVIDGVNDFAGRGRKGLSMVMAENHVLIVHFPSEARVRQLIDEIRSDAQHGAEEIVIISDQIDELPFQLENVMFVRGSAHDTETYRRASGEKARLAIVLSRDYNDANSDAIVAAAASVIDALAPEVYIVAECLHEKHRDLFRSVRCDAIVSGLKMAGNLLVQEVHDPGIARLMEALTSNRERGTLFSAVVPGGGSGVRYAELAASNLKRNVNILGVKRGDEAMALYGDAESRAGDIVVYVAEHRMAWATLCAERGD